jgi:hypothetical protein
MRLKEILLENPRDQLGLEKVADSILSYAISRIDDLYHGGYVTLTLKDHLPKGSLTHLYLRLRNTDVILHSAEKRSIKGSFSPAFNQIEVYGVSVDPRDKTISNLRSIKSTLVHELRHKLDSSLAGKEGFNSATKGDYLMRQTEINARLSSVMMKLNSDFNKNPNMTFDEYFTRFEFYASRDNLVDVFMTTSDTETDQIVKLAMNGLFGRQITSDDYLFIRPEWSKKKHTGVFSDKKFRRLVGRIYKMYEYLVSRNKK